MPQPRERRPERSSTPGPSRRSLAMLATLFVMACGGGSPAAPDDAGVGALATATNAAPSVGAASVDPGATDAPPASGASPDVATGAGSAGGPSSGGSGGPASGGDVIGALRTGDGTYHLGATGAGACEYDATPDDPLIAAINGPEYDGSAACGTFIRATGPEGTITVRIVDYCPECQRGDIDFSQAAFARIATEPPGRVRISWQIVRGDVDGPIRLRYREGSSRSWVAIQVRNHRLPITKLEVMPSGASDWRDAPRQSWNYFVVDGSVSSGPIRVRVTALDGQTLEEVMPAPQGGLEVAGRGQF